MKHSRFLSLLSVCLLVVFFSSCQQTTLEELPVYEPTELHGQDYLLNYFTPKVMFHYAYQDLDNQTHSGWIIDNKGTFYTYKSSVIKDFPNSPQMSESYFNGLLNISERVGKVDAETLVEHYKKIFHASQGQVETQASDEDANYQSSFYAYFFSNATSSLGMGSSSGGCSGGAGGNASATETRYNQVGLMRIGKENMKRNSALAVELVEWMKSVQAGM